MLVDDESAIRNILKISVNWDKYNMEIAGEANSGSEAISRIDDINPDLLIVDIRMPFMGGIEFSHIVSQRYPQMMILILSAYSDFSYAQECVAISNVIGYLIKPAASEEIEQYLDKAAGRLYKLVSEQQSSKEDSDSSRDDGTAVHDRGEKIPETVRKINQYVQDNYQNSFLNVGAAAE